VDNGSGSIYAKELVGQRQWPKALAKEAANTVDQVELLFGKSTNRFVVVTYDPHWNDQFERIVTFSHVNALSREP
jgi:hypothetical protein